MDTWSGEIFIVARHVPTHVRNGIIEALITLGAKVLEVRAVDAAEAKTSMLSATYVVCGYQSGPEYELANQCQRPIVGLQWMAAALASRTLLPASIEGAI